MTTHIKPLSLLILISFAAGLTACKKEKSEDLDKAREAMHDSPASAQPPAGGAS